MEKDSDGKTASELSIERAAKKKIDHNLVPHGIQQALKNAAAAHDTAEIDKLTKLDRKNRPSRYWSDDETFYRMLALDMRQRESEQMALVDRAAA